MKTRIVLWVALAGGCTPKGPTSVGEVRAELRAELPASPDDPAWAGAPTHVAQLLMQDLVEPRQMVVTTPVVAVQAFTDGERIAFRVSWEDPTRDDTPGPARFGDACAVQLPAQTGADVPAPQMGEELRAVEISHWSAVAQATVDGRPHDIHALYPRAKVDHYPFEAASVPAGSPQQQEMEQRYAPARAAGNPVAGPRERAVEDLVASGPGTLAPAPAQLSEGRGAHGARGWAVVISRPLPAGVRGGGRTQAAFAVWNGALQEVGARKMRTGWVPLAVAGASLVAATEAQP